MAVMNTILTSVSDTKSPATSPHSKITVNLAMIGLANFTVDNGHMRMTINETRKGQTK